MSDLTHHTQRLNDLARTRPETVNATWHITRGVAHLLTDENPPADQPEAYAPERAAALRDALALFNDWDSGNDPYGEHDFGALELFGARLFFKIDYYHPENDTLAPVPSNIDLCRRVLTVMLADEY